MVAVAVVTAGAAFLQPQPPLVPESTCRRVLSSGTTGRTHGADVADALTTTAFTPVRGELRGGRQAVEKPDQGCSARRLCRDAMSGTPAVKNPDRGEF